MNIQEREEEEGKPMGRYQQSSSLLSLRLLLSRMDKILLDLTLYIGRSLEIILRFLNLKEREKVLWETERIIQMLSIQV